MFNRLFGPFYDWHGNQPPFVKLLVIGFHILPMVYGIVWAIIHVPIYLVGTFLGYWWCDDCKNVFHIWKDGKAQEEFLGNRYYCSECYENHRINIGIVLEDYSSNLFQNKSTTLFDPKKEDTPDTI